ncbi:MAG: hypothetical protein AMJ81_11870, partial [Phycisphaerae bacterium SM23_33]
MAALLVLIWLAPYLLSTGPGTRLILSIVNPRLQGRLQVEDLSLSWLGGLEVQGLKAFDPDGREVLQVKAIRTARGLWYAIWSWQDFQQVRLESPRAVLLVGEEKEGRQISLARAFSLVKPRRPRSPRPLPQVKGQIGVAAGSLRVVLPDGRSLDVAALDASFDLKTLNQITGELMVTLPGEGKLACKLDLRGLTDSGKVRFATAAGTVSLHSVGDVDLGPLAEFAGRKGVRGKASLKRAQVALEPEKLAADFDLKLSGLAAPLAEAKVRPIDLGLTGRVNLSGEQVSARADLTGPVGGLHTEVAFNLAQGRVKLDPAKGLAAVLTGEPAGLPEFKAQASGGVDLATLAQAVPALLRLRPDAEVTGGTLRVEDVLATGGSAPSAAGRIELKSLSARRGQRTITFQPITAEFDAAVKPGQGLQISRAMMQSEFARLEGSAAAKSLQGRFSADLAGLHRQLAEVFELGEFELGGQVTGAAELAEAGGDRVNLTVHAEAVKLQYKSARGEVKVQKAVMDQTGYVTLSEGEGRRQAGRVTLTQVGADLDGAVVAVGAGWYDLKDGSFQGRLDLKRADLAYLGPSAEVMGLKQLRRYAGTVRLTATASRPAGQAAIESAGEAAVQDLRMDGEAVTKGDVKLGWTEARIEPGSKSFSAKSVVAWSGIANLTANGVHCRYADPLAVAARFELDADLGGCVAAAGPFLKLDKAATLTGRAVLAGDCQTRDGKIGFNGGGKLHQAASAEAAVAFSGSGFYDPAAKAFEAEVRVDRADLAYVAAQAEALGLKRLAGYAGVASAEAKAARKSAEAPVVTGGSATVQGLRVGGKSVSDKDVTLRWAGAEIQPAAKSFAAESVVLQSDFAGLTARDLRCRFGQDIVADGRVDVTADLAGCLAAARPIAGWKETPALAGRFGWSGSARSSGKEIRLTGKGGVDDFRAGSGTEAVSEKRVDLLLTARMDPRGDTLVLEPLKIDSGLLAADVTGTVKSLRSERLLDLKGHYRASWERLSKVLHQLQPDLAGKFELA